MTSQRNAPPRTTQRTERSFKVFLCVLCVLCGGEFAFAQFQMPDPKQMAGIPRPVTDLPDGSISVRLIRGQLSNNIASHHVELNFANGRVFKVNTDEAGRAQFDKVPAGESVKATADVDGEHLESQDFKAPSQGGIRLMLVATDKNAPAPAPEAPAVSGTGHAERQLADCVRARRRFRDRVLHARARQHQYQPGQSKPRVRVRHAPRRAGYDAARRLLADREDKGRARQPCRSRAAGTDGHPGRRRDASGHRHTRPRADLPRATRSPDRSREEGRRHEAELAADRAAAGVPQQRRGRHRRHGGQHSAGRTIELNLTDLPHHSPVPRYTALCLDRRDSAVRRLVRDAQAGHQRSRGRPQAAAHAARKAFRRTPQASNASAATDGATPGRLRGAKS